MEESILHGGEKELQELKKVLQEKNRYNAVLDSLTDFISFLLALFLILREFRSEGYPRREKKNA